MNYFICGSGTFHHQQDQEDESWNITSSSPRRSRRIFRHRKNKNPYSTRGLDKFAMVLADLEDQRQKIIEQMGTQDISLIRFGYSKSKGWVPIVIKLRNQKQYKHKLVGSEYEPVTQNLEPVLLDKSMIELSVSQQEIEPAKQQGGSDGRTKKKSLLERNFSSDRCRVPYYCGMVVVLILLCLAIYGRSFAIICTSILWYLMPKIRNSSRKDLNFRKSMKKNELFVKKMSDKKIKVGINGFPSFKTLNVNRSTELG